MPSVIERNSTTLYFKSCVVMLFCQRNLCRLGTWHTFEVGECIIFEFLHLNKYCINTLRCKVTNFILQRKYFLLKVGGIEKLPVTLGRNIWFGAFVRPLQCFHKIGCTSAIKASFIAFGLHYLLSFSTRRAFLRF